MQVFYTVSAVYQHRLHFKPLSTATVNTDRISTVQDYAILRVFLAHEVFAVDAVDGSRTLPGFRHSLFLSESYWLAPRSRVASNMGPWVSNQGGGDISNEGTDNSGGRDRRDRRRSLLSPF